MNTHDPNSRPRTVNGNVCATPRDVQMLKLLKGKRVDGVAVTPDQYRAMEKLYGFDLKRAGDEAVAYAKEQYELKLAEHTAFMADPDIPSWDKRYKEAPELSPPSVRQFMVAGAERNLFRAAKEDGLRVIAFMSKFLEQGEDPVKLMVQLMVDAGFDVGDHSEWAQLDKEGGKT